MSGSLRWWVIPGALVVMTGVLLLGNARPDEAERVPSQPSKQAPASASERRGLESGESGPTVVMARDASGRRQLMAIDLTESRALILEFPGEFAKQRIDLTLWRRMDGKREAKPWMQLQPLVRADGTLPMAGIVPGNYDIEAGLVGGAAVLLEDQTAPGRVPFLTATPVR